MPEKMSTWILPKFTFRTSDHQARQMSTLLNNNNNKNKNNNNKNLLYLNNELYGKIYEQ